jgi:hypothetical protein
MTTATVTRITSTGINYVVTVSTKNRVVFLGWNDAVIKSVTPDGGHYVIEGQYERPPFARPTVGEIVTAFENMASEYPPKKVGLKCVGCGREISEPNGGWPYGHTANYCPCGHENGIVNT